MNLAGYTLNFLYKLLGYVCVQPTEGTLDYL